MEDQSEADHDGGQHVLRPFSMRSTPLGADIVLYSAAKYVKGHRGIVMDWSIMLSSSLLIHRARRINVESAQVRRETKLRILRDMMRGTLSPFNCSLV